MNIYQIGEHQVTLVGDVPYAVPETGFLWIDATHDEVANNPELWRNAIEHATATRIYDLHLQDVINQKHPSYFDSTQDYAMVVFRKLSFNADLPSVESNIDDDERRKIPPALSKLMTQPVTFLLMGRALVTVHAANSRTIEATRARLLEYKYKPEGNTQHNRPPTSPAELALRLLNAMVDQYLDLRQPLTGQIDRWQRALLNPRRAFQDWTALLDARIELRKLDHLCEEQHDALQELRDYLVDNNQGANNRAQDLLLVRVHDVMEHINRVLNHARRLEASIESAVQIHFSAMAHRTSEIMRTLTVITALFMPLTVITGIFGMNFVDMPLLQDRSGFWIAMGLMVVIVVGLLIFFRRRRYLEDRRSDNERGRH
ncbi:magnesium transporter CorA family protein [Herminiimonas aquatilis]|uniref:Magnesium transporter CorA family protein n=1 Tax=Herminiimonas aquatilis TaxID=345342 RepID=A0ABW2J614_9BURK